VPRRLGSHTGEEVRISDPTKYWYLRFTRFILRTDNSPRVTVNSQPRSHALTPPFRLLPSQWSGESATFTLFPHPR
jgi:hypothetical protein